MLISKENGGLSIHLDSQPLDTPTLDTNDIISKVLASDPSQDVPLLETTPTYIQL